jgi:hypothetical protein
MNLKLSLNPKKFISNLPDKLSWQLLFTLIVIIVIGKTIALIQFGLDFAKQYFIAIGDYPAGTQITNEVLLKTLIIIFFGGVIVYAIKIGVLSYLFTLVVRLFKRKINFFKLVNIYLYSKIIYTILSLPNFLFIDETKRGYIKDNLLGKIENTELLKLMADDPIFVLFRTISTLLFFGILIYGISISINKNKIAPK